jgi:hypothetical protein
MMATGAYLSTRLQKLAFVLALLLALPWLAPPPSAFAAAPTPNSQTDVAAGGVDSRAASYLDQLLKEINARRAQAGSPPVVYAGWEENQAVSQYLADLTPWMLAYRSCFHGQYNPIAPSWDYVSAAGFDAQARGEVLGCPGDGFFWTPKQIADGWWNSPSHFHSLYGDASANAVACGTFGAGSGGRGYQTIACVTYHV